jgi:uroporphyrinogen decarboxylase
VISGAENVRRTVGFGGPERLSAMLWLDLESLHERDAVKRAHIAELQSRVPNDIETWLDVAQNASEPVRTEGVTRWTDEWNVGWLDDGHGARPEVHPLANGYDGAEAGLVPDPDAPGRFDGADRVLAECGERYRLARVWFTLFERLWMLRGFESILTDPWLHPKEFCNLRDRIVDFALRLIDRWLERGVDGIFFSDDWGTQRGLLVDPEHWRRFYRPSYARLFDRVRAGGAHVWMHLCGDVTAVLPDLVGLGLNVLNPVQPRAMDVDRLARDLAGRLCFHGGIDVQGTLIFGSADDVRSEVRGLIDLFGRGGGGYIAGTSHTVMPETPLDNVIAMYETLLAEM